MESRFLKLLSYVFVAFGGILQLAAQPKLMDAGSKIEYAIEWHLNGGVQNPANTDTYTAEDGLILAPPTRQGYHFNGWYDNANLTGDKFSAIEKGETLKKVFYAGWVITKEQAKKIMSEGMVTVIPAGKKVNMEGFAGTEGIQIINAYKIAKHEVTQELYMAVMEENPSSFKAYAAENEIQEKRPVEYVSWYDAVCFCNKLSMIMGLTPAYAADGETNPAKWDYDEEITCNYSANGYRLPTEAEWEMAARGGVVGGWDYIYAGSYNLGDVAWYQRNSDGKTHEVGKKEPNALGLYDMSGNVREWCDSKNGVLSSDRVLRGGSYSSYGSDGYIDDCEVSYRYYYSPHYRDDNLGFRVVCSTF